MLDTLNYDCILEIIKYLNLDDQLSLSLASNGVSNRLNSNVINAWKHQRSFKLNWRIYKKFEETPQLLDTFLTCFQVKMQKLKLHKVTLEFLKRWENYTFPNVKTLEYSVHNGRFKEVQEILTKLFPELRSVRTNSDIYCDVVTNWTQLRKLKLQLHWHHEADQLKKISKCQLLEDLTFNADYLNYDILVLVRTFPKLHTLTVYNPYDDVLNIFLEKRTKDVHKIYIKNYITDFNISTLRKLDQLRHLIVEDYEMRPPGKELFELLPNLKQLEILSVNFNNIWSNEAELWRTVASCLSLKILSIHNMNIKKDFFELSRCVMEKTLNNRSHPLTLYFDSIRYVAKKQIRKRFKHPRLKLFYEPFEDITWDDFGFLQINFKPLSPS